MIGVSSGSPIAADALGLSGSILVRRRSITWARRQSPRPTRDVQNFARTSKQPSPTSHYLLCSQVQASSGIAWSVIGDTGGTPPASLSENQAQQDPPTRGRSQVSDSPSAMFNSIIWVSGEGITMPSKISESSFSASQVKARV